ncbi:MAG: hypothetical protein HY721_17230 [Planctomycetes bacterium]|nr:hypothetical protein [Planctomycetota bacterium]
MRRRRRTRARTKVDGAALREWLRAAAYDAIADKFYEEMSKFWDDPELSAALRQFAGRAHARMLELLQETEAPPK